MSKEMRGVGVESLKFYLRENPASKVYDFSQITAWEQCGQKYAYKYIDKIPDIQGVGAAYSSHVMHPSVALCFQLSGGSFWERNDDSVKWWLDCNKNYHKALEHSDIIPNDKEMQLFTIENARKALNELLAQCRDMSIFHQYEYVNTETVYWRVMPGLKDAVWLSKPDVMLLRTNDRINAPVEVKVSAWNINMLPLAFDRQLLSQAWTSDAGINIRLFFWFEKVYKKAPQAAIKSHKKDMTATEALVQPEPANDVRVRLHISNTPPDRLLLEEWLVQVTSVVGEMQRARESEIYPKRAPRACHDFNHTCEFIDMCPLGVGAKYVTEGMPHVNPLEYLGL